MSAQTVAFRSLDVTGAMTRRRYVATVARHWREVDSDWRGAGTAFQGRTWLSAWYEAVATGKGLEPLIVTVHDVASGEVALRLPLVLRRDEGLRVVEFADLNLTDFNGPLVGPAAPTDRAGVAEAMRAVRRALPSADLLRLTKMPAVLGPRANPLVLDPRVVDCALNGNVVRLGDDFDAWRHSLGRTYRKELERSWRVFLRADDARFERITDPGEAKRVMAILEGQQGERMREIGQDYVLDDPDFSRFYATVVAEGVADGSVVVSCLRAGEEVVAAIVGVNGASGFIFIRISNAGADWSGCSPGRLVIERTIAHLHAEGHRIFDFSIGDYDYKRRFGAERVPLFDYVVPLSARGLKATLRARIVGHLRRYPRIDARLRAMHAKLTKSS